MAKKFEYWGETVNASGREINISTESMDRVGKLGWELVSVVLSGKQLLFFYKREIIEA